MSKSYILPFLQMVQLSEEQRIHICTLLDEAVYTQPELAAQYKSDHPHILTNRKVCKTVHYIVSEEVSTAVQVQKKLISNYKLEVSSITIRRQKFQNSKRDNNKEYNSSDNEDLDMGFEWEDGYFDKEESLFQTLVDNMKNFIPSKNSARTKRRKKKFIHEAIKDNGQTIDKEEGNDDEGEERNDNGEVRNDNEGKEENDDER
ncbi:18305_t:CDS:2, partial [Funneliformis geosporum]